MKRVSVVIPCFNGERYVGESLDSVLRQTWGDLEVIVVDDGSTDRSLEIVRRRGDPRMRVVVQSNAGVAAARNHGAAEASGEYLAFLDQDDVWFPEKLERQLPIFEGSHDVGLVYSDCLLIDESGIVLGRWSERYPLRHGRIFERLLSESFVPISTALMRRTTFEEVGGFNPRYRFVEDLDLLLRVAARYAVEVVGTPLGMYRLHGESLSRRLGVEVATEEFIALCREWVASDARLSGAVSRALARYLYMAGKTAFYQGKGALVDRYFDQSLHHRPLIRARVFLALVRLCPRLLSRMRATVKRLRRQTGPAPGTFPDRFA